MIACSCCSRGVTFKLCIYCLPIIGVCDVDLVSSGRSVSTRQKTALDFYLNVRHAGMFGSYGVITTVAGTVWNRLDCLIFQLPNSGSLSSFWRTCMQYMCSILWQEQPHYNTSERSDHDVATNLSDTTFMRGSSSPLLR